jgi:prepilin-type N-terminal cleavage/methylation domain-containing protein
MKLNRNYKKRGLTLTELLVVMLIIGLLATIAIPVYTRRQEDARLRVAMGECREIAHAEEQCALFHGFYVPFQMLDDLPIPSSGSTVGMEAISDDNPGNLFAIDPFTQASQQESIQANFRIDRTSSNARIRALVEDWAGPFMNFQRFYVPAGGPFPGDPNYLNNTIRFLDFPLDPWGNPYVFYSGLGAIGSSVNSILIGNWNTGIASVNISDGDLTTIDPRFDRYAVVSMGRDSVSDTGALGNPNIRNDIIYQFGSDGVESNFGRIF